MVTGVDGSILLTSLYGNQPAQVSPLEGTDAEMQPEVAPALL